MAFGINEYQIEDFFHNLSNLIEPEMLDSIHLKIFTILEGIGYDSETLMGSMAQPCGSFLKSCSWLGKDYNCSDIFDSIQTISGLCCTFNYHGLTNGILLNYRTTNRSDDLLYVFGAGKDVGLTVKIDIETSTYMSPTYPFYGAEIFVHHSYEQPSSIATAVVQPGHDVSINVIPTAVVSLDSMRDVQVMQRKCYFENEKLLRNTMYYSFDACMMECRVDTIFELCSCIPFSYPETSNKYFSQFLVL